MGAGWAFGSESVMINIRSHRPTGNMIMIVTVGGNLKSAAPGGSGQAWMVSPRSQSP